MWVGLKQSVEGLMAYMLLELGYQSFPAFSTLEKLALLGSKGCQFGVMLYHQFS